MNTLSLTSEQALELMLSLTPAEAKQAARRTAEIAEQMGDLGAGIRGSLEEIAAARAGAIGNMDAGNCPLPAGGVE